MTPALDSPAHEILAFADELAERPQLLRDWVALAETRSTVSLIVAPGSWEATRMLADAPPLLASVGIDDRPDSPSVTVLTGPLVDVDYRALADRCTAIYGESTVDSSLAELPRVDAEELRRLVVPQRRPCVRSFDVFDTLIARRCIEPARIFEIVAARVGRPDFSRWRREAEAHVAARPHTIDDIYDELMRLWELGRGERDALLAAEIEVELEQVIPIAENIASVRDGDLLVSDMYLTRSTIRELLHAAGVHRETGLVVTSGGKATGTIWPGLVERFEIERHTGDNPHSDVASPHAFGLECRHTDVHAPNGAERHLIDHGLRGLGELCRELRLATWSDDPALRAVQLVQAGLNVPMLAIGSVLLARVIERDGRRRVLFSSRDCFGVKPLFEQIAPRLGVEVETEYFYTSRLTRVDPSPDYLRYAGSLITEDTIVADVCGTGWSLAHLAQRLGVVPMHVFLLHWMAPLDTYTQLAAAPDTCRVDSIVGPDARGMSNALLEMCNLAGHGMVSDVQYVGGCPVAIFADDPRGQAELAAVDAQLQLGRLAVRRLGAWDLDEARSLSDESLRAAFSALYGSLSAQGAISAIHQAAALAEDARVDADLHRSLTSPGRERRS